jgi:hypothetical protein
LGSVSRSVVLFGLYAWGVLGLASSGTPVYAKVKLEEGEQVKVFYLGDWHDGVVVGQQGQRYGVQFEWGLSAKQEMIDSRF